MQPFIEKLGITVDFYTFLISWGLIFTRVFVMLILTPFIGGRGIPGRIRLLTSFVLSGFVYYLIGDQLNQNMPDDYGLIIVLFFKEIFFGLAIGFVAVMCFYAIEAGGRIVDSQRGSANAQIFLPSLGQVSIFGLFQYWLGLAFFLYMGGHITFLSAFFESFQIVPVYSIPSIEPGISPFLKIIIRMSADVLIIGMQLAAPVLIAIFLTDMVLGIANKMAPQIPVFEIGFMLKGYVGSIMVYVSVFVIVTEMKDFFGVMNENVRRIIIYFAG
ncbi:MAG: flagellar biosynthetic protein FliR [Deltaproteobacteria bacterium]|nr:flagellar biosynthetic protein FliR [Deltaproteobacteria bacterium]